MCWIGELSCTGHIVTTLGKDAKVVKLLCGYIQEFSFRKAVMQQFSFQLSRGQCYWQLFSPGFPRLLENPGK